MLNVTLHTLRLDQLRDSCSAHGCKTASLLMQTSTYTFRNTKELIDYQEGRYGSYEYGRYGNPTTRACEEKIRVSHHIECPV